MSEYQRNIVYLSEAQKNTLFATGSVTVGGKTVTYSDSDLYVTPTSSADIATAVEEWFNEHEITPTIEDGSSTKAKLDSYL